MKTDGKRPRKQRNREAIISRAAELFLREGFSGTSMAMIAKITIGIAIPFASVKFSDCRKSDTNAPFILIPIYQLVIDKLTNILEIEFSFNVMKAIYVPE